MKIVGIVNFTLVTIVVYSSGCGISNNTLEESTEEDPADEEKSDVYFDHEDTHSEKETLKGPLPRTLVIGVRGFRWDFFEKMQTLFENETEPPHFKSFLTQGVRAAGFGILPVFPVTPVPNLYTMVTGLYPAKHGVVADEFYDPKLKKTFGVDPYTYIYDKKSGKEKPVPKKFGKKIFGGEPIWETMHKGTVACMYWPGCEFGNFTEDHLVKFDPENQLSWEKRAERVKQWLDQDSVKLVLIDYRDLIDVAADHGPESDQVKKQLKTFYRQILELVTDLGRNFLKDLESESIHHRLSVLFEKLNMNLIVVGSSGLGQLSSEEPVLPKLEEMPKNLFDVWTMEPSMWLIEPKKTWFYGNSKQKDTNEYFKQFDHVLVYRIRYEIHDNRYKDNKRIPSLIIEAFDDHILSLKRGRNRKYVDSYTIHYHSDARPAFTAHGPSFKKGKTDLNLWFGTVTMHLLLCKLMNVKSPTGVDSMLDPRSSEFPEEYKFPERLIKGLLVRKH